MGGQTAFPPSYSSASAMYPFTAGWTEGLYSVWWQAEAGFKPRTFCSGTQHAKHW